jgi:pimeloyl-ACP methyl ester carboxylesterase
MSFTYIEKGPDKADAPALVLLHGIGSAGRSFEYQINAFSPRFRVLAWDAPGYGGSTELPVDHPTASDYAIELVKLLDERGIKRCHLLGHSLGCLIAARFTAIRPDRVQSLTLCSVATGHANVATVERETALTQRLGDLARLGPEGMAKARAPRLLGPAADPGALIRLTDTMSSVKPRGYGQAARMLSTGDVKADIARFPRPVPGQIIYGDADVITPPARNQDVAAAWKGVAVHVIPGAGHALYIEQPAAFNAVLDAFLSKSTGK